MTCHSRSSCCLFFFACARAHRDLRSFPTRRSSDLPMEPGTAGFWRIAALRGKNVLVMLVVAFCQAMATDRKSTRLNSSHVAISYAVFCLKKKKADISLQQYCKGHETGSS